MSDNTMDRLAQRLMRFPALSTHDCYTLAHALLPVVDAIAGERAAEALVAAYWATAAIPDPESVREVVLARADALRGIR